MTLSVSRRVTLRGVSSASRAGVKSLSVDRPPNVAADDVLLAVVVTTSSTVLKAPNGWSLVRMPMTAGQLLASAFAVRGTAALTEPATYDARVRVVSSTATSTTLLVTYALATTTGMTNRPACHLCAAD